MDSIATFSTADQNYMQQAIDLATPALGQTRPNPAVGCVIVQTNNHIVGYGYHARAGQPHAEANALTMAGDAAEGATAYVTLTPCAHFGRMPPCADGLIKAGIKRVVIACPDPNPQSQGGIDKLLAAGITVDIGCLADSAARLIRGFVKYIKYQLPAITLKLATTLDSYIADSNNCSQWISSAQSRDLVQLWRSQHDAIMVGAGTVSADNPRLNVRLGITADQYKYPPYRIVVDSQARISPLGNLFTSQGGPVIVLVTDAAQLSAINNLKKAGALVEIVAANEHRQVDLRIALSYIADKYQLRDIFVEGGARLGASLIEDKLVDEIRLFVAPKLIGSGLPALPITARPLSQALNFQLQKVEQYDSDAILTLTAN